MKKLLLFITVACLAFSCASAENLGDLSFDQLVALRDSINAEIQSRPEWKQVVVPVGEWIIGVDIPAGYYSISAADLAIVSATPVGSDSWDFRHVIAAGGSVGKVLFVEGSIFETSRQVVLAPPVSLEF